VLPCGLRVIVAQDRTLPVAAIVLGIETGTEDDPSDRLGLTRALAYHVLQGNREQAPGAAAAIVHDAGGLTTLAIGPAQIRYESLVPISRLDQTLDAEAHRLRAPTVTDELWSDSLRWTRRDRPRKWGSQITAIAEAHRTPSLAREPSADTTALAGLAAPAVAAALAERLTYTRATLTIVSPLDPEAAWAQAEAAFADLPAATRVAIERTSAGPAAEPAESDGASDVPRPFPFDPASGELFVWPVAANPAAIERATVWCRTLNRQRRAETESKRAQVRCHLDIDPRRSTLTVRASGSDDPIELLRARLRRVDDGAEAEILDGQRAEQRRDEHMLLRLPLNLASRLAQAGPRAAEPGPPTWRTVDELTGLAAIATDAPTPVGDGLGLGRAIQIVPPGTPGADP
jgi:hypothetical protein